MKKWLQDNIRAFKRNPFDFIFGSCLMIIAYAFIAIIIAAIVLWGVAYVKTCLIDHAMTPVAQAPAMCMYGRR